LPSFPATIMILDVVSNQLTELPPLPKTLGILSIANNPLTCRPKMSKTTQIDVKLRICKK